MNLLINTILTLNLFVLLKDKFPVWLSVKIWKVFWLFHPQVSPTIYYINNVGQFQAVKVIASSITNVRY